MKPFSWLACSLTLACALACCGYDNRPYGDTPARYSTPGYVSTYPRTYTSNRYVVPGNTRTYVYGDPLASRMSVGGYGYIQPAPRPAPWPLR